MARKCQVTIYTPEQIERGLFALAVCGNAAAAHQLAAVVHQHSLQADEIMEKLHRIAAKVFSIEGEADEVRVVPEAIVAPNGKPC